MTHIIFETEIAAASSRIDTERVYIVIWLENKKRIYDRNHKGLEQKIFIRKESNLDVYFNSKLKEDGIIEKMESMGILISLLKNLVLNS